MINFFRKSLMRGRLKRFNAVFSLGEKIILTLAAVGLVVGIVGKITTASEEIPSEEIPTKGGVLVEGVVATSAGQIDAEIRNLTDIGLMRMDSDGKLTLGLAKNYSISDNNKVYIFELRKNLNAKDIVDFLKKKQDDIGSSKIEDRDGKIRIELATPYSPFLANLSRPLLPYGPYFIKSRNSSEIVLSKNKNFVLGEPFIDEIDIKIYKNVGQLKKAFESGAIQAALINYKGKNFNSYHLELNRLLALFFNLDREPFNDVALRKKIKNNQKLDEETSLTITTEDQDILRRKLDAVVKDLEKLNIKVTRKLLKASDFREAVRKRDYEAALVGVDLGRDPDTTAFWHSEQATEEGKNLANFKDETVDNLLEKAILTTDEEKRRSYYEQVNKIIDEKVPAIFYEKTKYVFSADKRLRGVKINRGYTVSDRYANVWEWYLKTKKVEKKK